MHKLIPALTQFICIFFCINLGFGQVNNPSFDGPTGSSTVPPGWSNCGGSPDVQIISGTGGGIFGINTPPTSGTSYIGLVTTDGESYRESFGQAMSGTLIAGNTYNCSIDVFRSTLHSNWNGTGRLQIWGGNSLCAMGQLLWDSGTITNVNLFNTRTFSFVPSSSWTHIMFVNRMNNGSGSMNYMCADNFLLNTVLPVELTYFEGKGSGKGVLLNWGIPVAEELSGFIIEHSKDGIHFEPAGVVDFNKGLVKDGHRTFEWLDTDPAKDNYYRLRMEKVNGEEALSDVVQVSYFDNKVEGVYPNPLTGAEVNIHLRLNTGLQVQARLVDAAGRLLHTESFAAGAGPGIYTISVPEDLAPGVYILRISAGEQVFTEKIVK